MQKLAFDIGCNVGKYSTCLLNEGYSKVVAVDPNPHLFIIKDNRVTRVFAACSDKNSNIPFYFSNADTISTASINWVTNSRFSGQYIWEKYEVPSLTIDELVSQFGIPDHIKIDVEGYEEIVLNGMTKKYASDLCFEWAEEEGDSAIRCVDYLYSLGYTKFGYILTDTYLKKPTNYYSIDEFKKIFIYDKNRKTEWGMIWVN